MSQKLSCSFVNVTSSTSEEERVRNRYLIRARTVKRNRREQILRKGDERERYTIRKTEVSTRRLLPARQDGNLSPSSDMGGPLESLTSHTTQSWARAEFRDGQTEHHRDPNALNYSALQLTAPVSPFFGALATSTFDSSTYNTVSEVSVLVFQVLFSRVFIPTEIAAYWQAFCQDPLIFYSYAHLRLFVQDNVHGAINGRDKAAKYALNIRISGMLQQALPTLRDEDIEPVMLTMTLMAKHREDADVKALSGHSILFNPYKLHADLLEAFRNGHIESFVPAVRALVARIGGLHRLKTPGLSKMIRMNSLVQASTNCDPPYFDNCWDTHRLLAAQGPIWTFLSSDELDTPGIGFRNKIPGGLPPSALAACMNLSTTDRLLSQQRAHDISVQEFHLLTSARASVQHQLLSLPDWTDLPAHEQGLSSPFLYDSIRNTALLYCNAVVRPVLPGSRGILEPLRRLRQSLESHDVAIFTPEVNTVMLWCLVMGSLGSCSTQHWWFYITMLRSCLEGYGIATMAELTGVMRPFVWSDVACKEGLEVIWAAMFA